MPTDEIQTARFLTRKHKVLEWRAEKSKLGGTSEPWDILFGGSTGPRKYRRGKIVAKVDYDQTLMQSRDGLPVVKKEEQVVLVQNSMRKTRKRVSAAGVLSNANTYPPLPLTQYCQPSHSAGKPARPTPPPVINSRHRSTSLTKHNHESLHRGHGQVFDPTWGGRFKSSVGHPKGWKHGLFGIAPLSRDV
eukprot:TRINITY_DN2808_c6_g1_i1.p1 TRINITY_DN2808_c6_g1~~TRINITY_DN2808_c6_g1_i1.p1  ORF type:complete len:190 (+),score=15.36 TRINITY_DN2808_c6_g1_i1:31-600(+)